MADEFQLGSSGNWWDSTRTSFDSTPTPSSTTLNSTASFGWPTELVDMKARSCMDSMSVSGSSMGFADSQRLQRHESSSGGVLTDPILPIMGLGLASQGTDWNQAVFRDHERTESNSFRTMLQEGISSNTNFQQDSGVTASQDQWRQKIYTASSDDSSINDCKQINRGFSLDQQQFTSHISLKESTVTCQGLATSFQMVSAAYGNPTMLQGPLASDNQPQQSNFDNQLTNYSYPSSYAMNTGELMPNRSSFPQLLRASPPKQQPPHGQPHFSNSTPFWNATAAAMNDVRPGFFPSLQAQLPTPTFEEKQKKNTSEVRDLGTRVKKTSSETSTKRPRNETSSPLPACKVKKEKMADRITALQQLVSPFGKTDTASVLSEAFEYIKFLHGQVSALSTPYMKSGASVQHQQNYDKSKYPEGPKQDLRSRGLCFVPISSTLPFTHETTVDFWTPAFGGTFR